MICNFRSDFDHLVGEQLRYPFDFSDHKGDWPTLCGRLYVGILMANRSWFAGFFDAPCLEATPLSIRTVREMPLLIFSTPRSSVLLLCSRTTRSRPDDPYLPFGSTNVTDNPSRCQDLFSPGFFVAIACNCVINSHPSIKI